MYIIELTYQVSPEVIDKELEPHMDYLDKYYASGNFFASGRKEPRDGGIIFALAENRSEIERIVAEDPFFQKKLADYRIIEFRATRKVRKFAQVTGED
jgi:uncharacterized protein YciI